MTNEKIEKLLELIDEIVNDNASWQTKHEAILDRASESDKINLVEFAAWFTEEDE